jgi:hypothetical protein
MSTPALSAVEPVGSINRMWRIKKEYMTRTDGISSFNPCQTIEVTKPVQVQKKAIADDQSTQDQASPDA